MMEIRYKGKLRGCGKRTGFFIWEFEFLLVSCEGWILF